MNSKLSRPTLSSPLDLMSTTWPATSPSAPMALELTEGADNARRGGTNGRAGDVLEEGECEEHLAGEDWHVLSEDLVVGRLTAAEVVVDEGHGVDHLNDAEDEAHALTAGEEGVAHGNVDPQRVAKQNGVVERLVDASALWSM
ncbi:hypothetical protein VNO80_25730 [Phaseolus coccineus]|uniref:Uncharacterized protein n=1 Tax=Phaseolus coccineus TaxID=3886 RepID=A0AAN9LYD3_PHACN